MGRLERGGTNPRSRPYGRWPEREREKEEEKEKGQTRREGFASLSFPFPFLSLVWRSSLQRTGS